MRDAGCMAQMITVRETLPKARKAAGAVKIDRIFWPPGNVQPLYLAGGAKRLYKTRFVT